MNHQKLLRLIWEIEPEIIALRRKLHMFPELSFQEYESCQLITSYLDNLKIENKIAAGTGVIGQLMIDPQYPTVAVRAEMDALPIEDLKEVSYASKRSGVMHACGHDGISAITLGLARVLSHFRDKLKCNVKFIFEPGEEIGKGAKAMIEAGALEGVDKLVIFHPGNSRPLSMEIQQDISTAAIGSIKIKVQGKSSHWGQEEMGIDAIEVAAQVILAVKEFNRNNHSRRPFVVGVSRVNGGKKNNIIADTVEMRGTLRAFSIKEQKQIAKDLNKRLQDIAAKTSAVIDFTFTPVIPPIANDPQLVQQAIRAGQQTFGEDRVEIIKHTPFLAGDNAAFYFQRVDGIRLAFFAGFTDRKNYPLHSPRFDFNEEIIPLAIQTLFYLIYNLQFT